MKATADYFIARDRSVYAAALDISKAFDTVQNSEFMDALTAAGVPNSLTNVISNWHGQLFVAVVVALRVACLISLN